MNDDAARLIEAARAAAHYAYAPYSNFAVGAALLLDDGRIVTGCNFENASYGLALCAETVALAKANSDGDLARVTEIAVIGGSIASGAMAGTDPVRPCGRCRQVINEAAQLGTVDIVVHCSSADGATIESHRMSTLLPFAFGPADLSCVA